MSLRAGSTLPSTCAGEADLVGVDSAHPMRPAATVLLPFRAKHPTLGRSAERSEKTHFQMKSATCFDAVRQHARLRRIRIPHRPRSVSVNEAAPISPQASAPLLSSTVP